MLDYMQAVLLTDETIWGSAAQLLKGKAFFKHLKTELPLMKDVMQEMLCLRIWSQGTMVTTTIQTRLIFICHMLESMMQTMQLIRSIMKEGMRISGIVLKVTLDFLRQY